MPSKTHLDPSRASLLGLPWELREQIYHDYFIVEGGYVLDGATETLLRADGKPVDVSLRYTCRSIAHETRDLPFQLNPIEFSTVHREDWQETADTLEWVLHCHSSLQRSLLRRLRNVITADIYQLSDPQYLEHMPAIKEVVNSAIRAVTEHPGLERVNFDIEHSLRLQQPNQRHFGLPSRFIEVMQKDNDTTVVFDRAVTHVLRILAKEHPEQFTKAVDAILKGWTASHSISDVLDLTFVPWTVPSLSEVTAMAKKLRLKGNFDRFTRWGVLPPRHHDPNYTGPRYQYRKKAFFSASAMAIRFMGRITEQQRLSMRKIILNEDRPAVARALCHPIGLIPFCKQNKRLHIEHRWNLWTTLLQGMSTHEVGDVALFFESTPERLQEWSQGGPDFSLNLLHETNKNEFAKAFSEWTLHVLDVVKLGMPLESYSAVLDGDPDLGHATHTFHDVMEREIAWLTLNTDCVARGLFTPPGHHDYPFMTKPTNQGAVPPGNTNSLIQCNFTLDQPWDLNNLVKKYSVSRQTSPVHEEYPSSLSPANRFRVSTDILDLKQLELLMFERKRIPEETEATERNPEENELLQERRGVSQE